MNTPAHGWPVWGHDWAVEHLRRSLLNDRLRHAYLITGVDGIGKRTLAYALAMAVNCLNPDVALRPCGQCRACRLTMSGNHSDIVYTTAENGSLKIEVIRDVMGKLSLKPFEARSRIAIMDDFDRALPRAQDALLKTLEEPPPTALLILLAPALAGLMPTIVSRCQVLRLRPLALTDARAALEQGYGVPPEQADLLARVGGGRLGWAVRAAQAENGGALAQRTDALDLLESALGHGRVGRFDLAQGLSADREALLTLLELWSTYWRDALLLSLNTGLPTTNTDRAAGLARLAQTASPTDLRRALRATRHTLQLLSDTNVNTRLAVEVLFLDYPGLVRG